MQLDQINFSHQTVLEIGSGRGDTTLKLAEILSGWPDARLIVTDLNDTFFGDLSQKLAGMPVETRFLCTDAADLEGIASRSVDFIVCNYTLCAVDARAGLAALALRRFYQVLRPGGGLWIEEEMPMSRADGKMQKVWAEKWQILRAAVEVAGGRNFTEFEPELLARLCTLAGFAEVEWEPHTSFFIGDELLDFFRLRVDLLISAFPMPKLEAAFQEWADRLIYRVNQAGGMEVPYYRMLARK